MRLLKLAALGGLAITGTYALTEPSCGSVPTVFVTIPASEVTTTVTIALDKVPSNANNNIAKVANVVPTPVQAEDILTHITTTITSYVMFTQVLSAVETNPPIVAATPSPVMTSPEPAAPNQGPYYFALQSGTTFWLGGKTPPAGKSYLTSTTMITVLPVPSGSPTQKDESTSYSTITLTKISMVLNKVRLIKTLPKDLFASTPPEPTTTPTASAKLFSKLGMTGWNTSSISINFKASQSGDALLNLHRHQTGIRNKFAAGVGTAHTLPASAESSIVPSPTHTSSATKALEARQFGATVFATIEGVLVSWINTYAGATPETPETLDPIAFTTGVPKHEVPSSASSKPAKIPVYPWDLQFSPSDPADSTSSPTQSSNLPWGPAFVQFSLSSLEHSTPTISPNKVRSTFLTLPRSESTRIVTSVISIEPIYPNTLRATSNFSNNAIIPSPTASAVAPICDGEVSSKAEFTIDFDDLPHFSTGPNDTDIPPIFNPYRKLFFEDHYGYVPPPDDPFFPHSPPQLAVYRANAGQNVDESPDAGLESVGEFGSGPRGSRNAFWIDAYSMWLGCANEGPSDCIVTINGYNFTRSTRAVFQTVTLPPCPALSNCTLTYIQFTEAFRNLSGIQILAAVDQTFTVYYLDDLELAWSNNTCAAQLERSAAR